MRHKKRVNKIELSLGVYEEIRILIAERIDNGNYLVRYHVGGQGFTKELTPEEYQGLECNTKILDDIGEPLKAGEVTRLIIVERGEDPENETQRKNQKA